MKQGGIYYSNEVPPRICNLFIVSMLLDIGHLFTWIQVKGSPDVSQRDRWKNASMLLFSLVFTIIYTYHVLFKLPHVFPSIAYYDMFHHGTLMVRMKAYIQTVNEMGAILINAGITVTLTKLSGKGAFYLALTILQGSRNIGEILIVLFFNFDGPSEKLSVFLSVLSMIHLLLAFYSYGTALAMLLPDAYLPLYKLHFEFVNRVLSQYLTLIFILTVVLYAIVISISSDGNPPRRGPSRQPSQERPF